MDEQIIQTLEFFTVRVIDELNRLPKPLLHSGTLHYQHLKSDLTII